MDYREECRCGGRMAIREIENTDEVRRMVNTWRKYHACVGTRVDRETGEVADEPLVVPGSADELTALFNR